MSTRNPKDRLQDILHHINQLENFFDGVDLESFLKNNKDIFAVAMCFTIIGEAVAHIPKSFQEKHSCIPWKSMKDMRNFAVHQYWEVKPKILWNTFHQNIIPLKEDISELILSL